MSSTVKSFCSVSATAIVASSSQPLPKPPIANGDSLPTLPVHDFRSSPPSNKEIPSAVEMEIHFAHPTSSQMDDSLSDRITAEMISKTNEVEMEGSKRQGQHYVFLTYCVVCVGVAYTNAF